MKQRDLIQAAAEIFSSAAKYTESNYLVGLSGINCAGKSTLARALSEESFGFPSLPCVFDIDDFLHERKMRNADPDQVAGCYNSFDYATLFERILQPAKAAPQLSTVVRALNAQEDVYENRRIEIDGPCVVITEGIFLYRKDLPDVFDLRLWVEISEEEIVRRALGRSRELATHPDTESILNRYNGRFIPAQRFHLTNDRPVDGCHVVFEII